MPLNTEQSSCGQTIVYCTNTTNFLLFTTLKQHATKEKNNLSVKRKGNVRAVFVNERYEKLT